MKTIGISHTYQLQSVLGKGTYGTVYYSSPYAIKQLNISDMSDSLKKCVHTQTSILLTCKHPNIVNLVDTFREGKYVYLVMEYCQMDLASYIQQTHITEQNAIDIFKQIVSGFQALVQKNIAHRDLKPANILVKGKEFKLADFGLSKIVENFEGQMMYSIVGTPLYMAPQILQTTLGISHPSSYTTKCDIWSLGIIFYELLTRTQPWSGKSVDTLYHNIKSQPLKIPVKLSDWTKNILRKMLIIDEKKRIGWDELFRYVLAPIHTINRQRIKSQCKERKRQYSNNKYESKQKIRKNQGQSIECSDQVIRNLLEIQLIFSLGESKTYELLNLKKKPTPEDSQTIALVLSHFNKDFQRAIKLIYPHLI